MKSSVVILGCLLISTLSYAGKESSGGGDMCEDRIKIVRDDIASWIQKGGPQGLKLPSDLTQAQYSSAMLDAISQAKVSCTGDVIMIGSAEKTCKNYFDHGIPRVLCNAKKLLSTDESLQYNLVHHEYAGLARIEVADGEDSDYSVSNQISGFLVDEVVKKLVIAPGPSRFDVCYSKVKPFTAPLDAITLCGQVDVGFTSCMALAEPLPLTPPEKVTLCMNAGAGFDSCYNVASTVISPKLHAIAYCRKASASFSACYRMAKSFTNPSDAIATCGVGFNSN
jgi:hypothetical protein